MYLVMLLLLCFCCVTHLYTLFFIQHYAVLFTIYSMPTINFYFGIIFTVAARARLLIIGDR